MLAGDRSGLDGTLRLLGWSLMLAAVGLSVGTALAVSLTVRRGLRPLEQLAAEADAVRADSLHHRFSTQGLPAELRPICGRLNELLARLQEAFERERRFTADVAHELRTPIAELRSLAEVALRWPQDASPAQNYRDVLDVARHMESVVAALLEIARCESGMRRAGAETIDVCDIVTEAWKPHESLAIARGLEVCWDLPATANVCSDRAMLLGMIGNLLCNAVSYAPPGGRIECRVRHTTDGVELAIVNTCNTLRTEDLPRLFEPFWRKDAARTGGVHAGLGLPLVAAYAATLGVSLRVELAPTEDEFRIQLHLPAATGDERAPDSSPGRLPAQFVKSTLQT
jgi:two-component system sensor histidine kinase QseC